jgi:hypothetical protein
MSWSKRYASELCECHDWPKLQCPNTTEAEKAKSDPSPEDAGLMREEFHHRLLHQIEKMIFGQ